SSSVVMACRVFLCFFFQAEDGIRDFHVTGVQTCALPISHTASIVIALLPWVMLAIGLWLLLLLLAHARANRVEPDGTAGADDLLPFEPARPEPAEPPAEVRQAGPQARDAGDAQGPAGDRTADAETAEVRPAAQADEPTASGTALAASEPSGDEHAAAEPPDRPAGGPDATEPPSHEPSGAESPAPADPAAETGTASPGRQEPHDAATPGAE